MCVCVYNVLPPSVCRLNFLVCLMRFNGKGNPGQRRTQIFGEINQDFYINLNFVLLFFPLTDMLPFRVTLVDRSIDGSSAHRHAPPPSPSPPPLPPQRHQPQLNDSSVQLSKQVGNQNQTIFISFYFFFG